MFLQNSVSNLKKKEISELETILANDILQFYDLTVVGSGPLSRFLCPLNGENITLKLKTGIQTRVYRGIIKNSVFYGFNGKKIQFYYFLFFMSYYIFRRFGHILEKGNGKSYKISTSSPSESHHVTGKSLEKITYTFSEKSKNQKKSKKNHVRICK